MIVLINDSSLIAYEHNDFYHTYDTKETLTDIAFLGTVKKLDGTLVNYTITKSGTNIILSLTKSQIDSLGLGTFKFDIKKIQNSINSAYIKGTLTIKDFITI